MLDGYQRVHWMIMTYLEFANPTPLLLTTAFYLYVVRPDSRPVLNNQVNLYSKITMDISVLCKTTSRRL